jgi:hypothetical protein
MTTRKEPESHFNQRADNAALALKGDLSRKLGKDIPSVQVAVGPDGKPPPPPPPEGSYAAMQLEQDRQAAIAHQQQQPQVPAQVVPENQQQILGQQPQVGPTQAIDGSVAPPLHPTAPPQQASQGELSPNAQARFTEMSTQLRELSQNFQQSQADLAARDANIAELQANLEAAQRREQEILQANLDELDPETRARVLADSRMQELFADLEQRLTAKFSPAIETLEVESSRQRMMELAKRYPAFDIQIHGPLIEMYRGKNPHSSVAQAFKAIAQDGELVTRDAAPLQVVPPIVQPGGAGGQQAQPRYLPEPQQDPEAEMREDARRAGELMRSGTHADRAAGMRMIDKNLSDRLSHILPG